MRTPTSAPLEGPDEWQATSISRVGDRLLTMNATTAWLITAGVLLLTMLVTRVKSGERATTKTTVPTVPYWLPVIGNFPQLLAGMDTFLSRLR